MSHLTGFWNSNLKLIWGKVGQIYLPSNWSFYLTELYFSVTCRRSLTIPMNSHQFAPWWDGCRFMKIGTTQIRRASLQITEHFLFQDVMILGNRQLIGSRQTTWLGSFFLSSQVKYNPLQKDFLYVTKLDKQSHQKTETLFCLLLLDFNRYSWNFMWMLFPLPNCSYFTIIIILWNTYVCCKQECSNAAQTSIQI